MIQKHTGHLAPIEANCKWYPCRILSIRHKSTELLSVYVYVCPAVLCSVNTCVESCTNNADKSFRTKFEKVRILRNICETTTIRNRGLLILYTNVVKWLLEESSLQVIKYNIDYDHDCLLLNSFVGCIYLVSKCNSFILQNSTRFLWPLFFVYNFSLIASSLSDVNGLFYNN